ncbi:hypothetical protein EZMO1_4226 [Endozoicomonas montiporae CL-33]|uniref:Uncharacterized protein n=1 Tax=Endozoicomonas montiporae CL-33 TaxID=570277 RepID=A0A142BHC3_9GAMM|nr:hypothetical protein EZMO1_4226 [Endozoicomonas montiporae CL-33]
MNRKKKQNEIPAEQRSVSLMAQQQKDLKRKVTEFLAAGKHITFVPFGVSGVGR